MGGGDGDGDGGVADVESSDAVVDGDLGDVPALSGFLGDLAHDGDGHVGVGVVDEVVDVASEVVVADDAEEECDGAGVGSEDEMVEGGGVERVGGDLEVGVWVGVWVGAAADGRDQGDGVGGVQGVARGDVFGVDGEHDRVAHGLELGEALDECVGDVVDGGVFGEVAELELSGAAGFGE